MEGYLMTQREAFEAWWGWWGQAPVELQPLQPRTREDTLSAWVWEAWQAAQAAQPAQVPAGSIRLWDAQWASIVNHDNAYNGWSTNDAVNHAVRMTERYIAANVAQNNLPPLPAAPEVK